MLRVFLLIDDYNELIYLQTLLKKLGFDVEGLQNQKKYLDVSLGFNPHILITTAKGKKVDGISLAKSIRKTRGMPKVLALKTSDQSFNESELSEAGIDRVIESPINPKSLMGALAQLGDLDESTLFDKYVKIKGLLNTQSEEIHEISTYDENGQAIEVVSAVQNSIEQLTGVPSRHREDLETDSEFKMTLNSDDSAYSQKQFSIQAHDNPDRQARFVKAQNEIGSFEHKSFDRERIKEFNKKIRAWPKPDDISEIENERKSFVKALFKKT